jgi:hypothetical protein
MRTVKNDYKSFNKALHLLATMIYLKKNRCFAGFCFRKQGKPEVDLGVVGQGLDLTKNDTLWIFHCSSSKEDETKRVYMNYPLLTISTIKN